MSRDPARAGYACGISLAQRLSVSAAGRISIRTGGSGHVIPREVRLPVTYDTRRYLTNFDSSRVPHILTDVLIIGSGIAG